MIDAKSDNQLIYDWNAQGKHSPLSPKQKFVFLDETLRDGIQSPSVVDPKIEDKIRLLELSVELGIQHTNIGLPGAGERAVSDCTVLAEYIRDQKLPILPAAAARTHPNDVQAIVDISQRVGIAIEVMTFIGSSPIRAYVENWDLQRMQTMSADAIRLALRNQLPVTYVTEDTTRSNPHVLDTLFRNAIDHGAQRLCLCDTVGYATPVGVRNLIKFTANLIEGSGHTEIGIDWHGHNDRGLAVSNAILAIEAGADRIHGTALGVGERVGNAALDQIMLNLKLQGELEDHDLRQIPSWCELAAKSTQMAIPPQYPVVGSDAFRTATGVHAAAIIKAEKKGNAWLADRVYSSVPASMFGKNQEIEVGHYSGESNVVYWLRARDYTPTPVLVKAVLRAAKQGSRVLTETEITKIVEKHGAARTPTPHSS